MRKPRLTQKKAVFYVLWQARKQDKDQYVPAWKFVGELYIKEQGRWFFMSYKTPANGVAIYHENPGLIERRETRGKSGAKYYEYRITPHATFNLIKDEDLRRFARGIENIYREQNTNQT